MKKLLLFSIISAFIVPHITQPMSYTQTGGFAQTMAPATTLRTVKNKTSGVREYSFAINRQGRDLLRLNLQGTSVSPFNIPLMQGDVVSVFAPGGSEIMKYTPSGRTPNIDLVIYDERAIVVPAGTVQ